MERVEVKQPSFMLAHRYDEPSQSLTIEFKDGRRWTHAKVPADLYREFLLSDFPMLFWAVRIRQARDGEAGQPLYPLIKRAAS